MLLSTSHIEIFLILCIQFVLCMDCVNLLNKKDMSPCSFLHNLMYSAFDQFSGHNQILYVRLNSCNRHPASLFQFQLLLVTSNNAFTQSLV